MIVSSFEILARKIKDALSSLERKIPIFKETDMSSLEKGITDLKKTIISIPQPKEIEFAPILEKFPSLKNDIQEQSIKLFKSVFTEIEKLDSKIENLDKRIKENPNLYAEPKETKTLWGMPVQNQKVKTLWG